jgi:60 kDa SS-A/Ro ribonucleoprotein
MSIYMKHLKPESFTQTEKLPGTNQERNSAGGFSFVVDDFTRLQRFLILGNEGGTYYASEKKLTRENASCVEKCLTLDYKKTIDMIVDVSVQGRAPKNDPAIFALALAASYKGPGRSDLDIKIASNIRGYALSKLSQVCRIGTHLFQFVDAVNSLRGWGKGLRKAVARWYTEKSPEDLAYQVTKYSQRNGWSHKDVLRLCHASQTGVGEVAERQKAVLRYAVTNDYMTLKGLRVIERKIQDGKVSIEYSPISSVPSLLDHIEAVKKATDPKEVSRVIRDYGLVREVIPTRFLNSPDVWDALLHAGDYGMPLTALIRNLGKMTSIGLVSPLSSAEKYIVEKLSDGNALKTARVHPLTMLNALAVYGRGRGDKGSLTWTPSQQVSGALDRAFYAAFKHVVPAGKRYVIGVDVSGSMSSQINGMSLSCCQAATAMAMVLQKTEPWTFVGAFNMGFQEIPMSRCGTLQEALRYTENVNCGGTDCSIPIVWALQNKVPADVFVTLTDSETWAGSIHPSVALKKFREQMGIPAKLAVFGMTATQFSIADPNDSGMLDLVGLDTSAPEVLTQFAK